MLFVLPLDLQAVHYLQILRMLQYWFFFGRDREGGCNATSLVRVVSGSSRESICFPQNELPGTERSNTMHENHRRVCCNARAQATKFVKPPSVKRGFLRRLLRDVEEHGDAKLELARFDRLLGNPDYHLLKCLTSLDVHRMLRRYTSKLEAAHLSSDHIGA